MSDNDKSSQRIATAEQALASILNIATAALDATAPQRTEALEDIIAIVGEYAKTKPA